MTTDKPVKLSKPDRELLALMVHDPELYGKVYYVPGRWHATNSEGRTRYSFQRTQPAQYGFRDYVRVTAPIERLLDAGLVDYTTDPEHEYRRCPVTVTQTGRDWLAAYEQANPAPTNGETSDVHR